MSFKTTYILFGIVFGLVVVFGLILWLTSPNPPDETLVFPSLNDSRDPVTTKDIDAVVIQKNAPKAERVAFEHDKESGRWGMTEPFVLRDYRVDRTAVDRLVDEVREAKKNPRADVNSDLKQWGLDNPAVVITLRRGSKEWTLNLGRKVETKGGQTSVVYVTSSDRKNQVMAVPLNQLDSGFKDVDYFRDKALLADSPSDIQSVSLHDGKHNTVILKKESGTRWRIAQPDYGEADYEGEPASPGSPAAQSATGVRGLLDVLTGLKVDYQPGKVDDFVAENPRDLAQYGLEPGDKPGRLRIEVTRSLGGFGADKDKTVQETLLIGKKEDKGDKYYALLEDEKEVVKVSANLAPVERVLGDPGVLRDRDLVHVEEFRTDAVVVKNDKGTVELFKPQGSFDWKLYRDSQMQSADGAAVQALLGALTAKRQIVEFPDPKADEKALGLDQPSAVVSLWENGIAKDEEKKDENKDADKKDTAKEGEKKKEAKKDPNAKPKLKSDKPTVKLTFGKRGHDKAGKDVVYVRREAAADAAPTLAAVPASLLDKVAQGPLAYADKTLPSFAGQPTRLVIDRGGQVFDIDKADGTWKFKLPKDWAGRTANQTGADEIITDLRNLRAEKLVAEKAGSDQEQQYGLKAPRLKATVVVPGKDKQPAEEHVYLFGDDAKDEKGAAAGVYAKQAKHGLIFTANKGVVGALQGELRDPILFHFDPAKVKGLKLTGWYAARKQQDVLDLEQPSPGKWAVKKDSTLTNLNLDTAKVEELVNRLANLRIEQFLDPKSGPKPEKMDIKDDALEVQVTVEGEKEPLTLTLGGLAPDKGNYFAASNRLPGEYFLVWKEPFEKMRAAPAYFSK